MLPILTGELGTSPVRPANKPSGGNHSGAGQVHNTVSHYITRSPASDSQIYQGVRQNARRAPSSGGDSMSSRHKALSNQHHSSQPRDLSNDERRAPAKTQASPDLRLSAHLGVAATKPPPNPVADVRQHARVPARRAPSPSAGTSPAAPGTDTLPCTRHGSVHRHHRLSEGGRRGKCVHLRQRARPGGCPRLKRHLTDAPTQSMRMYIFAKQAAQVTIRGCSAV